LYSVLLSIQKNKKQGRTL